VQAEFEALERIAENSRGDVRSAINDLQSLAEPTRTLTLQDTLALSSRNRDISMDETLIEYFSAKTLHDASTLLSQSNVDYDELLMAVGDNLPKRYQDPNVLAEAYDYVSQADVFRGRIGTENWHLLKYVYNALAKAASVAPETYEPFSLISPPIRVITLFWTKPKRTMLDNICLKIGQHCHVSKATAKTDFVPFIRILLTKSSMNEVVAGLELQPEEVEFLMKMNKL
jgi:replication factor C large subunit